MSIKWIIRNKYIPYLQTVINVNLHANALTSYYEILILASYILDLLKFMLLLFDSVGNFRCYKNLLYSKYVCMYICKHVSMYVHTYVLTCVCVFFFLSISLSH